jgi:heat shock transcription factor
MDLQNANGTMEGSNSIERLEERASIAKRDAQSKQKQIPLFVQKLSR